MSDLLNDQNEFDHVVKDKPYRYKFLEELGKGWNLAQDRNLNSFEMEKKLTYLLEIMEQDLSAIEQNPIELKRFALFLGFLIGMLRRTDAYRVTHCTKTIINILYKLRNGYREYHSVVRKLIIEWFNRNADELLKESKYQFEQANLILNNLS